MFDFVGEAGAKVGTGDDEQQVMENSVDAMKCPVILEANRPTLKGLDTIDVARVLRIPELS